MPTTHLLWPFLQCIVLLWLLFVFVMLISLYEKAIQEHNAIWAIATVASALAIYVFVGDLSDFTELQNLLAWSDREIWRCHHKYENGIRCRMCEEERRKLMEVQ